MTDVQLDELFANGTVDEIPSGEAKGTAIVANSTRFSDEIAQWREAVTKYEFVGGRISSFRYLDYYDALATVRGAVSGKGRAVAFEIDSFGKRRVLDSLP